MVGTDYPLLDLFLTMLWFFLFVICITAVIMVIFDVFRSRDLSGWAKAGWFILVLIFPIIGVIAYLLAAGRTWRYTASRTSRRRIRRCATTCAVSAAAR